MFLFLLVLVSKKIERNICTREEKLDQENVLEIRWQKKREWPFIISTGFQPAFCPVLKNKIKWTLEDLYDQNQSVLTF